jgi:catechol 2,3-dioxygenase-like lactoylglutathione lyase family enzyme
MGDWEKSIGAMTLFVPDVDEARKFYETAFGGEAHEFDDGAVMLRGTEPILFLHKTAVRAEPVPEVLEEARKGAGQFAIIVADVDEVSAELTGRGVELISGPANRDWGMRTITFADPAGHVWEIAQEIADEAESA